MNEVRSRTVMACGSGVTLPTNSPLGGASVTNVSSASTSVFFGNALVSSRAIADREASSVIGTLLQPRQ